MAGGIDWDRIGHQILWILLDEGLQAGADPAVRAAAEEIASLTRAVVEKLADDPGNPRLHDHLTSLSRAATGVINAHRIELETAGWHILDRVLAALIRGLLAGLAANRGGDG